MSQALARGTSEKRLSIIGGESGPTLTPEEVTLLAGFDSDAARGGFFLTHPHLVHAVVVEQLADRVREHVRIDVHEAKALADAAVLIAREVESDETLARALRAKANACWFLNDLKTATELFEWAAGLFAACGQQGELARTLSSSIQSLILLGEYNRALEAADRARQIFETLGDDRRLARLDINVANIYHRQDRVSEAFESYERAYERLLPHQDVEGLGVALHNMAVCLIVLNDFDRALAVYQRAREHCLQAGMPVLVAQADYNIAYLYYFRGDYSRAIEMLRDARAACEKVGDRYHAALCNLDQSEIYLELNLSTEAAEMAREAQAEFEQLGNGYEAARTVANLAIAAEQDGESFRALELFGDARQRFEREQNAVWPSVIDLYQGLVLCNAGRFFEARRLGASALAFFRSASLDRKTIVCELLLARIDLQTEELESASEHCRQAIADIERIEAPVLDYQAYFLMGQIHEAADDADSAYAAYLVARERLEALRSVLWSEDLKIAFMKAKHAVYERLVALCMDRDGDAAEIFGYIEQAKSRSLRDLFFDRVMPVTAPTAGQSELVRQIRTLREELNWYYHRVELEQLSRDDRSTERLQHLQEQLRDRERSFVRMLRDIPQGTREEVGFHDTAAASVEEIRSALAPGTTIVEYFKTGDRIVAVVLSADSLTVTPLTTASRVDEVLRLLQFQLSKFQFGPQYIARVEHTLLEGTQAHLKELYDELLAPLQIGAGGHLVIVPHDLLHYVPFHALFDGQRYLVDTTSVSYAPSATIYSMCCRRDVVSGGRPLLLGVPDERAPFIEDEVRAVAGLLPDADLRIGAGASADVLRECGGGCRLVHIATHGHFREDNPLFSGVRLGDSYLTVHDLYGLRLPVDLITLSGCGTGLNVVTGGDELRGLVRGLLAAGARSALVTLWDVHDRSTAEFMTRFYTHLQSGTNKAESVRRAMLDLRASYPHPYFWAPFVLVGADSAAA